MSPKPWQINCKKEALPTVTFHFRHNILDSCVVDMRLPPGNSENQHCMRKILLCYQASDSVYFIWLIHGLRNSGKHPWMKDLKDSYFTRYPENSELVVC